MLRRALWILLGLVLLLVLGLLAAPFLVDPESEATALPVRVAEPGRSRFVTLPFDGTDGIDIHYLERPGPANAAAPPFLLLHGFTLNAFTWDPQLPLFAARGRVVAYDQIPYGLSEKLIPSDWRGANPYAKAAAVAQVIALMDALELSRAILVGNSSGGTLALEVALAHPERVAGLILVAPWVYVQRPVLPAFVAESPPLRRLALFIARRLGADGGLLDFSYADESRVTEERRRLASLHAETRHWDLAWRELLSRSLSTPVTVSARLGDIRQPALVITGDADRLVPAADSERVAGQLPNSSLRRLRGCGHVPHEECPGAFAKAVTDWLTEEFRAAPGDHADAEPRVQQNP